MTTETLSSSDDDRPRRRPPRWLLAAASSIVLAAAVIAVVEQQQHAAHRAAQRERVLDDARVDVRVIGGSTGNGPVVLDVTIENSGAHPIVVQGVTLAMPGVRLVGSSLHGHTIPAGLSAADELRLSIACATAVPARGSGELTVSVTTAAHRRHVVRVEMDEDPNGPTGAASGLIHGECGATGVAGALLLAPVRLHPRTDRVDISLQVTNTGRSPLVVRTVTIADDRLQVVGSHLPVTIAPRRAAVLALHVVAQRCGPEANHGNLTMVVAGVNEYGRGDANFSDDELDRAFRDLVARHCARG